MSARDNPGSLSIVRAAAWFALAAGLLEAALLTAHGRLIHGFIYLNPHLVWIAPLTNLLWFGLLALLLWILGRAGPRWRSPGWILGACSGLAAFAILLIPSQLHRVAAALLALGVGYQFGRWAPRHLELVRRTMRWSLPAMAVLVLLLAGGTTAWQIIRERQRTGALGPAGKGPNVVLIVLDTVRRASMSLYGYDRETTPALTRWAARGVRFDHAFSTASWTLPSHAGMFTGRLPHELNAGWLTPLDGTWPTLAEVLGERGYLGAGFVANILYCNRSFGLARGFVHYEDYPIAPGELLVNNSIGRTLAGIHLFRRITGFHDILARKPAEEVTDAFLEWEARQGERPWFAFLNYFDAHQPYLPPEPGRFGPDRPRNFGLLELRPHMGKIAEAESRLTAAEVRAEQNAYDAAIAHLDRQLDRLLTTLETRGELDNTVVIITSDHGEQFMEHGLFDHGNSLYRYATEVPLVLLGRSVPAGLAVAAPVSLRDLPATVLDLAQQAEGPFPGTSLGRFWGGSSAEVPVVMETSGPGRERWFRSIIAGDHQAIWSASGPELYQMSDIPQLHDQAGSPEGRLLLSRLAEVFKQQTGNLP